MNHKTIFIGGFTLLHFELTVMLFVMSFSLSMARFDSMRPPTARETVLERLSGLFLFPSCRCPNGLAFLSPDRRTGYSFSPTVCYGQRVPIIWLRFSVAQRASRDNF